MASISNIRRGRQEKIKALGASFAIGIAREKEDPLYLKYQRFREKFLECKKLIIKKYGRLGIKDARAKISSSR